MKRNSFSGILKRQKFIVTKIRNPDGTTEIRRELFVPSFWHEKKVYPKPPGVDLD